MAQTAVLIILLVAFSQADEACLSSMHTTSTTCHPLNESSKLPKKCLGPQWSLDAPCPHCWSNTAPDYTPGAPTTLSADLRTRMSATLTKYLARMEETHPPSQTSAGTVFSGLGGRALLLLKLYAATGAAQHLQTAREYTDAMLTKLPAQRLQDRVSGFVGFQWSHVGMLCIAAVCAELEGDTKSADTFVAQVRDVFEQVTAGKVGRYDDFDSGRAGLLFAGRFLEANLAPRPGGPLIPRQVVLRIATAIVDRGAATAAALGHDFLQWHGPNDKGLWLGQSHGSAGVLQHLLEVPELLQNSTATAWIAKTLDHIVGMQLASGNFPTEYYRPTEDVLIQWDHGAPGVSAALIRGWRALGTTRYKDAALKALEVTWYRGLLFKGLMTCHGIGGNTWMQLYAGKVLGGAEGAKYTYRALQFQEQVLGQPLLSNLDEMRVMQPGGGSVNASESAWSFWTGSVESAVLLWTELLHRGPANASLTGWEPAL